MCNLKNQGVQTHPHKKDKYYNSCTTTTVVLHSFVRSRIYCLHKALLPTINHSFTTTFLFGPYKLLVPYSRETCFVKYCT